MLVTTTLTAPAAWAGVVAVMEVALTTFTPVAAVPPKLTVAPDKNPVPVMVTAVPPAVEPEVGETAVTVGAGFAVLYVYPLVRVPLCPSLLVTTTFTAPTAWAGVVAVIELPLTTFTPLAAVPPKLTVAPDKNPVPAMVTEVPPALDPAFGETELTVGAGFAYV